MYTKDYLKQTNFHKQFRTNQNIPMKEKFIDRLFLFLEKQGGVYQVADKMEMSPQNFYNMKRRNSLPNLTMVYQLFRQKYS